MQEPLEGRSSEELAQGAQAGSRACFGELVTRHERALRGFLFQRTRSKEDAEELAQESFLRAWRKIDTYRGEWKFSTWLFALARRVAATRIRRPSHANDVRRAADDETIEEIGVDVDPGLSLGVEEEHRRIWDLAARLLTEEQRSALWLRYAEDQSIEEIGAVLGRRPVAVRAVLFRGRETLARYLGPPRPEPLTRPSTSNR